MMVLCDCWPSEVGAEELSTSALSINMGMKPDFNVQGASQC